MHQVDVDKVANMIAKKCCAPDPVTGGKICHLWNQTRLGQDNLIDRGTISRLNFVGFANASSCFAFSLSWLAMCLSKLAGNT